MSCRRDKPTHSSAPRFPEQHHTQPYLPRARAPRPFLHAPAVLQVYSVFGISRHARTRQRWHQTSIVHMRRDATAPQRSDRDRVKAQFCSQGYHFSDTLIPASAHVYINPDAQWKSGVHTGSARMRLQPLGLAKPPATTNGCTRLVPCRVQAAPTAPAAYPNVTTVSTRRAAAAVHVPQHVGVRAHKSIANATHTPRASTTTTRFFVPPAICVGVQQARYLVVLRSPHSHTALCNFVAQYATLAPVIPAPTPRDCCETSNTRPPHAHTNDKDVAFRRQ